MGRCIIPADGRGEELVQLWRVAGVSPKGAQRPGCLAVDEVESVSEARPVRRPTGEREQPVGISICWDSIGVEISAL